MRHKHLNLLVFNLKEMGLGPLLYIPPLVENSTKPEFTIQGSCYGACLNEQINVVAVMAHTSQDVKRVKFFKTQNGNPTKPCEGDNCKRNTRP